MPTASEPEPPGRRMVAAMALCSGLAVANIYYNQPMLALIKEQYGSSITWLMPTFTQLGYALGLLLLVPLGDLMERRRLIVTQFVILSVTLVFAALATAEWALVCASLLIGVFATVAQQIVPFAAALSPSTIRGRTIGTVMSCSCAGFCSLVWYPALSRVIGAGGACFGSHRRWRFWARGSCAPPCPAAGLRASSVTLHRSHRWRSFGCSTETCAKRPPHKPPCSHRSSAFGRSCRFTLRNQGSVMAPLQRVCSASSARWEWPSLLSRAISRTDMARILSSGRLRPLPSCLGAFSGHGPASSDCSSVSCF